MTAVRIVRIWYRGALIAVKGAPTPIPGLYVTESPVAPGLWNITHLASGAAIAIGFEDPEHALHIAVQAGPLCDWTTPGASLRARDDIRQRLQRLLEEEGIADLMTGLPAVRERDLAAMEPLS